MRNVKMLGLAAMAALAAMAIGSFASSASADVFCEENVGHANECPAAKIWTGSISLLSTNSKLLNASKSVIETCSSNTLALGSTITNGGPHSFLKILVHSFNFSGCSGSCPKFKGEAPLWLKALSLSLLAHIEQDGALAPSFVSEGCPFGVTCLTELHPGKSWLLSLNNDVLTALDVPLLLSNNGFGCPALSYWDVDYLIVKDASGVHGAPLFLSALP